MCLRACGVRGIGGLSPMMERSGNAFAPLLQNPLWVRPRVEGEALLYLSAGGYGIGSQSIYFWAIGGMVAAGLASEDGALVPSLTPPKFQP